jgi:hypothetical protein
MLNDGNRFVFNTTQNFLVGNFDIAQRVVELMPSFSQNNQHEKKEETHQIPGQDLDIEDLFTTPILEFNNMFNFADNKKTEKGESGLFGFVESTIPFQSIDIDSIFDTIPGIGIGDITSGMADLDICDIFSSTPGIDIDGVFGLSMSPIDAFDTVTQGIASEFFELDRG